MSGDISRRTFDPKKGYTRVNMQQGRVQLDADWNEQQEIHQHRIETEALDVIGQSGAPIGYDGFKIETDISKKTFTMGEGRMYVDGILCQNDAPVAYGDQPFLVKSAPTLPALAAGDYALVYLEAWERELTALEDPSIREQALGGPDTATRGQSVWQVKVLPLPSAPTSGVTAGVVAAGTASQVSGLSAAADRTALPLEAAVGDPTAPLCTTDFSEWTDLIKRSDGKLNAQTQQTSSEEIDPCLPVPSAGYQRLENQLYRVEIHDGGAAGTATFKWSRDNGTVVTEVKGISGTEVTVSDLGRDAILGFDRGQWVELLNDNIELKGGPGQLFMINDIDPANLRITLDDSPDAAAVKTALNNGWHPKLRRWDFTVPAATSNGMTTKDGWIPLEGGIQVQFSGTFKTGDYWLIPARTARGEIEWPRAAMEPIAQPPLGITRHYCKLALIKGAAGGTLTVISDCRRLFPPLTELPARPPAIHVTNVRLKGSGGTQALRNDSTVSTDALAQGILIDLDAVVLKDTLKPATCFVTLEVPESGGAHLIGFRPLVLGASIDFDSSKKSISWQPAASTVSSLLQDSSSSRLMQGSVLARLTVKGSFVWGGDPRKYLDGNARGLFIPGTAGRTTDLALPSGNGIPGSDFEMWFWVTQGKVEPPPLPGCVVELEDSVLDFGELDEDEISKDRSFKVRNTGDSAFRIMDLPILQSPRNAFKLVKVERTDDDRIADVTRSTVSADSSTAPWLVPPKGRVRVTVSFTCTGLTETQNATLSFVTDPPGVACGLVQLKGKCEARERGGRCSIDADKLSFEVPSGKPSVTRTVTITNDGFIPLSGEEEFTLKKVVATPPFSVVDPPAKVTDIQIPKGRKLTVTVKYERATGAHDKETGSLTFVINKKFDLPAVELTGRAVGQPLVSLSADEIDLGSVTRSTATERKVVILNSGDAPLEGNLSANQPHLKLSLEKISLDEGAAQHLVVSFLGADIPAGEQVGAKTGAITIRSNDPANPSLSVPVRWTLRSEPAHNPVMSLSTSEINLGSVTRATAANQMLVISNGGNSPLEVSVTAGPSMFAVSPEKMTIDAGASQQLTVSFVGTAVSRDEQAGAKTSAIAITSNDPKTPGVSVPVKWNLMIEPQRVAVIALSANEVNLGDVTRAATANQGIVISNSGSAPLEVNVSVGHPALAASFGKATVEAAGSQNLIVSFVGRNVPSDEQPGAKTGTITITGNDPKTPSVSVPVKWHLAPEPVRSPVMSVSVSDIDFGGVTHAAAADKKFVVSNSGNAPLQGKMATDQPQLKLSVEQLAVDAGGSQKLIVSFVGTEVPPNEQPGPKTGTITITSNDPKTPSVAVPVKWTLALEPAKRPALTLSPAQIDLGDVTRATIVDKTIVKITNSGDARLDVKASTAQSVLTVSPDQISIDPSATQKLVLRFVGTAIPPDDKAGAKTASVTITSNDPNNPTVAVPVKFNLTVEPVKRPILDLSAREIDLGNLTRATTVGNKIVILNKGNAPLEATVSTAPPVLTVSPQRLTIDAGGSQTLSLSLVGSAIPSTEKAGAKIAAINIASNDPSTANVSVPVKWNLAGEPVKNPILDLSVREIDLGDVTRATTADKTVVKITNNGDARLDFRASTDQPVLTVSPEQATIDPAGTLKLVVRFVGTTIPTIDKVGTKTGAIKITSNDPSNPNVSVPVKWNLTSEPVKTPVLTLSVTEIDLGDVTRATIVDKTIVKITNSGDARLDAKATTDQPVLTVSPDQTSIDPSGTQKLAVRFVGTAIPPNEKVGAKTGTIKITSNDPRNPNASVSVKWNLTSEPVPPAFAMDDKREAKPKRETKPKGRKPTQ